MRFLPLLFVWLCTCALAPYFVGVRAQPTVFEKFYDSGTDEVARAITLLPGRVVIAGYTEPTDRASRRGSVYVTDRDGRLLSARSFPSARRNYFLDVVPSPNTAADEYLIGGWINDSITLDNWAFYRLNTAGDQQDAFGWGRFEADEEVFGMLTMPDGTIVAVGAESASNKALIARFTATGTELWRRAYVVPDSRFTSLQRVVKTPEGLLAAGWSTENQDNYSTLLVQFDDDGNLLWRRKFDWPGQTSGSFRHVVRLPSGRIVLIGQITQSDADTDIVLLETDRGGNLLRSSFIGGSGRDLVAAAITSANGQEGFFLAGRQQAPGESRSHAFVIGIANINNPVLSARKFAPDNASGFFDMTTDEDGNYWLAGYIEDCTGEGRNVYLVKTDVALQTTATGCRADALELDGAPLTTVSTASVGEASSQTDPRVVPGTSSPLVVRQATRSCPMYDLDADDSAGAPGLDFLIGPRCYDGPLTITDSDVGLASEIRYTDSIVVRLRGSTAAEFIRSDTPEVIRRSPTYLVVPNDGTRTDPEMTALLQTIRYHNEAALVSGGRRTVAVGAYTACEEPSLSFTRIDLLSDPAGLSVLKDTFLCRGNTVRYDATTAGITTYNWGDGAQGAVRELTEPGEYVLRRGNDCGERRDTFRLVATATPVFPRVGSLPLCPGDSVRVDLRGPTPLTFTWADGSTAAARAFRQPAILNVTASDGCVDSTFTVSVSAQDCCPLYLPTAFSPNGDGVNDRFGAFRPASVSCEVLRQFSLRIFDRWGAEVFRSASLTESWDGTVNGRYAATGHYVYTLSYFDGFVTRTRNGSIVLVR